MPKIIVSVTNDLNSDQRVLKICETFRKLGYEILLIGRKLPQSQSIERPYQTHRMRLFFNKGFLFYASYNIRLFFKLLFTKTDLLYANDLDTLLPNFIIAKIFRKKLIYDSHELFTEIPELKNRPLVKAIWLAIEKPIFKRLKNVITVNQSIADFYHKKYGVDVKVIKNMAPILDQKKKDVHFVNEIKGDQKMLILQGSGINKDRGAEEAVKMMQYLEETTLYIIGGGDVFVDLKNLVNDLNLHHKVKIINKMPYLELMEYAKIADLGLSLDKGTNLNYQYSLPNKVFDYIQANTPMLVSNMIEVADLVNKHEIGAILINHNPNTMASQIREILNNTPQLIKWRSNLGKIQEVYSWENESKKLNRIIENLSL